MEKGLVYVKHKEKLVNLNAVTTAEARGEAVVLKMADGSKETLRSQDAKAAAKVLGIKLAPGVATRNRNPSRKKVKYLE